MGTHNVIQRKSGRRTAPRLPGSDAGLAQQLKAWLSRHGEPDAPIPMRKRISAEFAAAAKKRKP